MNQEIRFFGKIGFLNFYAQKMNQEIRFFGKIGFLNFYAQKTLATYKRGDDVVLVFYEN